MGWFPGGCPPSIICYGLTSMSTLTILCTVELLPLMLSSSGDGNDGELGMEVLGECQIVLFQWKLVFN